MPLPADKQKQLDPILAALRRYPSVAPHAGDDAPRWFTRAMTNVLLLMGDDPAEYVAGAVDNLYGDFAVLTGKVLILSKVAINNDPDLARASAYPRSKLSTIMVRSSEGVLTPDDWPGEIRVSIGLGKGVVALPYEQPEGEHPLTSTRDLLASYQRAQARR